MQVFINQNPFELPDNASLADAVELLKAAPPFAAAVNLEFVPRAQYADRRLEPQDRVEIIAPVTGG